MIPGHARRRFRGVLPALLATVAPGAIAPRPAAAVAPKTWTVSTQKDLLEGEGASVRIGPTGALTLGLRTEKRATLDEAVVWALAPGPGGSTWSAPMRARCQADAASGSPAPATAWPARTRSGAA